MALLASKGIIGNPQILTREASHRGESIYNPADPLGRACLPEDYGLNFRALHQDFAEWVWDSSEAGIVVLVDNANESRSVCSDGTRKL